MKNLAGVYEYESDCGEQAETAHQGHQPDGYPSWP